MGEQKERNAFFSDPNYVSLLWTSYTFQDNFYEALFFRGGPCHTVMLQRCSNHYREEIHLVGTLLLTLFIEDINMTSLPYSAWKQLLLLV